MARARGTDVKKGAVADLSNLRCTLKKVEAELLVHARADESRDHLLARLSTAFTAAFKEVHGSTCGNFNIWSVRQAHNNLRCMVSQPAFQGVKGGGKKICLALHRVFLQKLGHAVGSFSQCCCNRCRKAASAT